MFEKIKKNTGDARRVRSGQQDEKDIREQISTEQHESLPAGNDEDAVVRVDRAGRQRVEDTPSVHEGHVRGESDEAEAQLVEQARKDPAAFGAVYDRYVNRIYAYIYHRVGNTHDAEDITARTFYRALDKLDTYEDRGLPFSAWLFRIAHNLVANWHRDRSRRRFLSLDRLWSQSQHTDTPEEKVEREERHAALWSAINRLPKERQNLLLYKFGSMLSNLEIGDLMGKSESAIKSLYFRTLAALRTDLESRGWNSATSDRHTSADDTDNAPNSQIDAIRQSGTE